MAVDWEGPKPEAAAVGKRRHVRVAMELTVSFVIVGDGASSRGRAVTRDISHGGACLALFGCTEEMLARLEDLPLLDVAIDTARAASLRGRVERVCRPAGPGAPTLVGMEFCNLSVAEEIAIIDLIAHVMTGATMSLPPESPRSGASRSTICG